MSVITESALRSQFKKSVPKTLEITRLDILTPSASQYLREKGVEISYGSTAKSAPEASVKTNSTDCTDDAPYKTNTYESFEVVGASFKPKFVSEYDGGMYEEKPEYMTHLYGNRLVYKDDPRIAFRGRLDSFQSSLLRFQLLMQSRNNLKLVADVQEILELARNILMTEVKDEPLEMDTLFGLDSDAIRAHSHNPMKHYCVKHFVPDVSMGEEIIHLNELRTEVREIEIAAMSAFRQGSDVKRKDIICALNRLSSAFYILMCRILGERMAEK